MSSGGERLSSMHKVYPPLPKKLGMLKYTLVIPKLEVWHQGHQRFGAILSYMRPCFSINTNQKSALWVTVEIVHQSIGHTSMLLDN